MMTRNLHLDDTAHYRICAQGLFDVCWLDMLSGVWGIYSYQPAGKGITILVGQVADQAALMGVLEQLYSLGLPLLLVEHLTDFDPTVTLLRQTSAEQPG